MVAVAAGCGRTSETPRPPVVINEVAPAGDGDWFEVLNVSDRSLELSDYIFVDIRDDFVRARHLDEVEVAPGGRYVQGVSAEDHGFALGDGDGLWLYAFDDRALVDDVTWRAGDARHDTTLARLPDGTGAFHRGSRPSPGYRNRRPRSSGAGWAMRSRRTRR